MVAQIADNALIPVRVLPKDVFYHNHDLFDYILSSHLCSDKLLEGKNASLSRLLDLNCDNSNSRDRLPGKSDVDFLSIVLKLVQKLIYIREICKSHHQFKLSQFDVEWVLKVAEKDTDFSFKDLRVLH